MATKDQANDIRAYMVSKGIAGSRVVTFGNGDMFPIYEEYELDKMTPEKRITSELANRRIEISIIKQD